MPRAVWFRPRTFPRMLPQRRILLMRTATATHTKHKHKDSWPARMCCCWDWLCQLLASCCPNAPVLDTGDVVNAEAAARGEFILRIVPLSSRALHVAWGEPSGCYGWYKIRYRRRDRDSHGKWESIKPKFARNTADLTGLKVDTEYEVQIEKKDGPVEEQTYSRSYFGRTKPGTRSDRRYEADRGAAESRPLLFHT